MNRAGHRAARHGQNPARQSRDGDVDGLIEAGSLLVGGFGLVTDSVNCRPSELDQEVLFAAKVVVEGPLRYLGGFDDLVNRYVIEGSRAPKTNRRRHEFAARLPRSCLAKDRHAPCGCGGMVL